MIQTVRVQTTRGPDTRGRDVLTEIKRLGITGISDIRTARVYRLEVVLPDEAHRLAKLLFAEEMNQEYTLNAPLITDATAVVEVAYKPGVMNPEVGSIMKAARDLGFEDLVAADSSTEYGFSGTLSESDLPAILDRLLVNKTVERVVAEEPETLIIAGEPGPITIIPIRDLDDEGLMELSRTRELHLNLEEMRVIQVHFREIGRDPIDAELETIAQTWSEHCYHKTFKAKLIIDGREKEPLIERLKRGVERFPNGVLSAFEDNS